MTIATDQLDQLAVDTIRTLSIDGVQQANSGHPGAPMGMAPMTYALWTRHLRHAPTNPAWPNRDRFVLSAGHASMLLYSMLHLTGYGVSLEDVESFRQWGSITPGHPEYGLTPGVEATTGPLGQGLTNAVGMAIAERRLAAEFNRDGHELIDHRTYVICSDGDLQEGVGLGGELARRAPQAGQAHRALRRQPDPARRPDGLGVHRGRPRAVRGVRLARPAASRTATTSPRSTPRSPPPRRTTARRSSPSGRSSATAPRTRHGTQKAHGAPLGPDEVRLTKEAYGWDPDKTFYVPDEARDLFRRAIDRGQGPGRRLGRRALAAYAEAFPAEAAELKRRSPAASPTAGTPACPTWDDGSEVATRNASQDAIQLLAAALPELFGGSADLSESNLTDVKANGHDHFEPDHAGRNLRFGVREHAMGGIVNGIAYHGGFLPYAATFLTFSDYMRGSVRLAALCGLHVTYVWTHDSVGLGEDGPTHQPVEHYAGAARDPQPVVRPARATPTRRPRPGRSRWSGRRSPARCGRPGRAGVHAPEAADARRHEGARA